jgi:predicted RNA-binding protein with PUA domain
MNMKQGDLVLVVPLGSVYYGDKLAPEGGAVGVILNKQPDSHPNSPRYEVLVDGEVKRVPHFILREIHETR